MNQIDTPQNVAQRNLIIANSYPGVGDGIYACFNEKDEISEQAFDLYSAADPLANFIIVECNDAMSSMDLTTQASRLIQAFRSMQTAVDDLTATANGVRAAAMLFVLRDFWIWFQESKRTVFTMSLFQSWIDVYPEIVVISYKHALVELLQKYISSVYVANMNVLESDWKFPFDPKRAISQDVTSKAGLDDVLRLAFAQLQKDIDKLTAETESPASPTVPA